MSSGRRQKTVEFTPPEVTAIAAELGALRVAGSGWINLMPGIDEEASDVHPRAGLFAFFGSNAAPASAKITMTSTFCATKARRSETALVASPPAEA